MAMELEEYARIADAEQRHWWYRSMPDLARTVLGDRLRAGIRILDAGCGPGANYDWLSDFGEVVGVDYSPEAVRLAGERHPEMEARQADITAASVRGRLVRRRDRDHRPDRGRGRPPRGRRAGAGDAQRRLRAAARARDPAAAPRARRGPGDACAATASSGCRSLAIDAGMTVARATYANSFLVAPAVGQAHRTAAATPPRRTRPRTSSGTGSGESSAAWPPPSGACWRAATSRSASPRSSSPRSPRSAAAPRQRQRS